MASLELVHASRPLDELVHDPTLTGSFCRPCRRCGENGPFAEGRGPLPRRYGLPKRQIGRIENRPSGYPNVFNAEYRGPSGAANGHADVDVKGICQWQPHVTALMTRSDENPGAVHDRCVAVITRGIGVAVVAHRKSSRAPMRATSLKVTSTGDQCSDPLNDLIQAVRIASTVSLRRCKLVVGPNGAAWRTRQPAGASRRRSTRHLAWSRPRGDPAHHLAAVLRSLLSLARPCGTRRKRGSQISETRLIVMADAATSNCRVCSSRESRANSLIWIASR